MEKMYLVELVTYYYSEENTCARFVTKDKEYAKKWVKKFNHIIDEYADNTDDFLDMIREWDDKGIKYYQEELIMLSPIAKVKEIEVR